MINFFIKYKFSGGCRLYIACSRFWILGLVFWFTLAGLQAQNRDKFLKQVLVQGADTLLYRVMFPSDFDSTFRYPVLFFLHGSGERGNDNERQLVHGASFFASDSNREKFRAVVIFPQCPENDYWARVNKMEKPAGGFEFEFFPDSSPTKALHMVMSLMQYWRNQACSDTAHFYIGGLSMGGMGTFELVYRMPGVFAAAFPICGGNNATIVSEAFQKTKWWVFHGDADNIVLPEYSYRIVKALRDNGKEVKYTIYPGVGHGAWDFVFRENTLIPWLLKQ